MNVLTDQYFNYRESAYEGIGQIDSVKGNTIVWNQLQGTPTSTSGTVSGVSASVTNGIVKITGTASGSGDITIYPASNGGTNIPANHLLLICANGKGDVKVGRRGFGTNEINNYVFSKYTADFYCSVYFHIESGKTYDVEKQINVFDLTTMFGSTKADEIYAMEQSQSGSGVSYFRSLFPLPYYQYEQGKLLSFNGNGIKTVGKNLIDVDAWLQAGGATYTKEGNKYTITSTGNLYTNQFVFSNITPHVYSAFANISTIGGSNPRIDLLNNGTLVTSIYGTHALENYTFNSIRLNWSSVGSAIVIENFQIEFGANATEFEPFTSSTLDIPTSTYFPTGMKSAGSVYDELTNSKAITRIGEVDLGSLTWTFYSVAQGNLFRTSLPNMAQAGPTPSSIIKAICAIYESVAQASRADKTISGGVGNTNVDIIDNSYSDAQTFKTAMNGVMLYYELETPTEVTIYPPLNIFYKVWNGGTEEILPVNTSIPSTSPFFGTIKYMSQTESLVPYRTFWLVNGDGERWDFTKHELKSFLNEPQGLGFNKTINITRYGEKAVKSTEIYEFPTVSGDLLFYDTANSTRYDKYNEFVRFLMIQPITLYYQIPVSVSSGIADLYTLNCEVTSLTKTESKPDKVLTSTISLSGMGFYESEEVEINGSGLSYTITNDGDFPVGFEIEIEGSLENPYVTLEQDGELYGEAKFDDTTAFDKVYVDSKDGEQNVILEQGGSILPNPLSYQDLSISNGSIYVTFVKLARGQSTLTIGMDSGSITSVSIKYTPQYRSV